MFLLQWSSSLDHDHKRGIGVLGSGLEMGLGAPVPARAWLPNVVTGENTSETESIESRESAKSRETSPSHSPPVSNKNFPITQPEVRHNTLNRDTDSE